MGLTLLLPFTLAAQALPSAGAASRLIDSLARDFVATGGAPSVAIGVVRGDEILALRGYGMADLENEVPATAHSVYEIGSVTKQFTSSIIMQLIEGDSVHLEDPISRYVTGLPAAWQPVTIHQLLNHTSGIPSYTELGEVWRKRWGEQMTPDTIIALTFAKPLDFAPGSKWQYNNTGYILLGMVIEKVTGMKWGEAVQQRLASPLGLTDTRECLNDPIIPHRAHGYEKDGDGWGNTVYLAMTQPLSAGALCSTVVDLARWNRALHTGKVVSAASYRLMTTPAGAAAKSAPLYGFGLIQDTLAGRPLVTHGGGIFGFITGNAWVPSAGLSLTVLTNSGSAKADGLLKQLARAALGAPLEQPATAMAKPLPSAEGDAVIGTYTLELPGGARDFTVAVAGDHLTGQLAGQGANPMLYLGDHTFGMAFDASIRIVFTVEGGRATMMTLNQAGQSFAGKRK